jgi:HPt (histidine-containing phosphotransfer) domain-containing protein
MTAHALKGDRERCLGAGMDGYVSKPVQPQALFHEIERLFPSAGRRRGAAPDMDSLLNMVRGNRAILKELIGIFFEDYPLQMAEIEAGLSRKDPALVQRACHMLRGSVSNFGYAPATESAQLLEAMARSGSLEGAPEAAQTLRTRLKELHDMLQKTVAASAAGDAEKRLRTP